MNKFQDFNLKQFLVENLKSQGIDKPTPIQDMTIPIIMDGSDVLAEAQTGTGKTLAFLLPIFQNLDSESPHVQALIVTPTRELAIQITSEAKKLASNTDITILPVFGGQDINAQLKKLNGKVDIVVATPGRLLDHIRRETVDISHLSTLVLDEADQMLYIGFRNEVEMILKSTNKDKQTLCFSATLDSKVKKLAYKFMKDPLEMRAPSQNVTLDTIEQRIVRVSDRWKQEALFAELDSTNPFLAIIFCRTKRRVDKLEEAMSQKKYLCNKLHGGMTQSARQKVMKSFREARIQYLVATDVAARGLDISGVSHIYNFDVPEESETYIHRIGRTGRMGDDGVAITFVAPKDEAMVSEIEKKIGLKIPSLEYSRSTKDKK